MCLRLNGVANSFGGVFSSTFWAIVVNSLNIDIAVEIEPALTHGLEIELKSVAEISDNRVSVDWQLVPPPRIPLMCLVSFSADDEVRPDVSTFQPSSNPAALYSKRRGGFAVRGPVLVGHPVWVVHVTSNLIKAAFSLDGPVLVDLCARFRWPDHLGLNLSDVVLISRYLLVDRFLANGPHVGQAKVHVLIMALGNRTAFRVRGERYEVLEWVLLAQIPTPVLDGLS